jgi:hypothetical protein
MIKDGFKLSRYAIHLRQPPVLEMAKINVTSLENTSLFMRNQNLYGHSPPAPTLNDTILVTRVHPNYSP